MAMQGRTEILEIIVLKRFTKSCLLYLSLYLSLIPIDKMSTSESEKSIKSYLYLLCSSLNMSCHFASGGLFRESK